VSIAIENVQQLPYEAISNQAVSSAVAALSAARVAADEAKKTHVQLEQELPNAHQEDAAADERLRAEGKPRLKGRPATQAAEKGIADAAHEQLVCELAVGRARDELVAALDEHGAAWAGEVAETIEALQGQWQAVTGELSALHARLASSVRIGRAVGMGSLPSVGTLPFMRRQIDNCEFATGQPAVPAFIGTGDVLAALAAAVEVEPQEQPEPVKHGQWMGGGSPNAEHGAVQDEMRERREFAERVAPDVERRRRRNAQLRAEGEAALAEQAAAS
jgi:hypothetical protein